MGWNKLKFGKKDNSCNEDELGITESERLFRIRYKVAHEKKQEQIMEKLKGTISPCLRWAVFIVNVFFWIIGLFFISLGLWAYFQKRATFENRTIETWIDVISDLAIVCSILGLIIFSMAFTGCVGVLRQNIRLLKVYRIALMGILAIQFLVIIIVMAFTTFSMTYLQKFLEETVIKHYKDDLDMRNLVDWLQESLGCCGVGEKAYRDWEKNPYFNCSSPSAERCSVPYSCCQRQDDVERDKVNTMCGYNVMDMEEYEIEQKVWPIGCLTKINGLLKTKAIYASIGIVIYMIAYCAVIDVIAKLIYQIEYFRITYFSMFKKKNSISDVSMDTIVKRRYKKRKEDMDTSFAGDGSDAAGAAVI